MSKMVLSMGTNFLAHIVMLNLLVQLDLVSRL